MSLPPKKRLTLLVTASLLASLLATSLHAQNSISPYGPKVVIPTKNKNAPAPAHPSDYQHINYIWHRSITATIFWIGEDPTPKNPTPNHASSWDTQWEKNFGGFDNPSPAARNGLVPRAFTPKQNPFYIALPYNDVLDHRTHKATAARYIPWFKRTFIKHGTTVCKGRWVHITYRGKSCYAQWEDCGPFSTDDYRYVFGTAKPQNKKNGGAGIDLSPAIRDFLKLKSGAKVDWRFIEFAQVPKMGPWASLGDNNPFVNKTEDPDQAARLRYFEYLRKKRDEAYRKR